MKHGTFKDYLKENAKRTVNFSEIEPGHKFKIAPGGDWVVYQKINPAHVGHLGMLKNYITITPDGDLLAGFMDDNKQVIPV